MKLSNMNHLLGIISLGELVIDKYQCASVLNCEGYEKNDPF